MIEFIPGFLFTWFAIWMLFAFLTNLAYPLVRRLLRDLHPATASGLLFAWITLPAFTALLSCTLLFAPLFVLMSSEAHCPGGHCEITASGANMLGIPALVIGVWLLGSGFIVFKRYWLPAHRLAQQLKFAGRDEGRFVRLPSSSPAAFTLGWLKPRIYLTDGLLEQCSEEDIACILNHEEAHLRRRDNLSQLTARLFTIVLPTKLLERQLDDYNLLCEQACDLDATRFQPADEVAGTLLKVARLQSASLPVSALGFIGDHIEQRILSVLKLQHSDTSRLPTILLFTIAFAMVLVPAALFQWLVLG